LAALVLATSTPVLVYLGSVGVAAVCLRFWEGGSAGVRGHLDGSGVHVRMNILMFAQDQYFRELLVVMGLVSPYQVTVSSVAWLGFPSVSLAPSFLVRSRIIKPLSQLSFSQPVRALSLVESCRLVGE
jgi:hypothetical protein